MSKSVIAAADHYDSILWNRFTMVGCAAVGCTNRSEHGFRVYGFPLEENRRKRWQAIVRRENFSGTNSNKICEVMSAVELWPWEVVCSQSTHCNY